MEKKKNRKQARYCRDGRDKMKLKGYILNEMEKK